MKRLSVERGVIVSCVIGLLAVSLLLPGCAKVVKVGEMATNKSVSLTVHSVKFYDQIWNSLGQETVPKEKGDVFAVVDLTVKSVKEKDLKTWFGMWRLAIKGEKTLAQPTLMTMAPAILNELESKTLNPGQSAKGTVTFSVAKGAELEQFVINVKPEIKVGLAPMKAEVPAAKPLPAIGQPAEASGLQMTLNSVTFPASVSEGLWTNTPKAGQKLCYIDMTLKNLSIEPKFTSNSMDVSAVDANNQVFSALMLHLGVPNDMLVTDVAPGQEYRANALISVAADADIAKIRYTIGTLGPPLEASAK